jgi:hypothetical protein
MRAIMEAAVGPLIVWRDLYRSYYAVLLRTSARMTTCRGLCGVFSFSQTHILVFQCLRVIRYVGNYAKMAALATFDCL